MARTIAAIFLLLLAALAPEIAAQELPAENEAGFEGQNVSRVDVSAKPGVALGTVRSLIKLKVGEPLAMAAVRESATALQATKQFIAVQVSITPAESGVDVLFILQPTSYVGILDFPGATKTFSYPQLLQVVNIPEQSAYVDGMPDEGAQALLKFFQRNGFFQATVKSEIVADDPHRVVNIRFVCQLNKPAKIGDVNIAGLPDAQAADVRRSLRSPWAVLTGSSLKPGKKYSEQRINKSLGYIRKHLQSHGRLAPLVQFVSSTFHSETGRADLNFQVDAGPELSVRVMGARVSGRTIRRLVPIYEENAADQDLVDEGARNLRSYFQAKGYFDVQVDPRMTKDPDAVSVVYQIERGEKHQVESVDFRGNSHLSDQELQGMVGLKKGRSVFGHFFSHGTFSQDLIRKSTNAIIAAYKDAGFPDVRVTPEVKDYEPRIDVTFAIEEGEQNKVNALNFINNHALSREAIIGRRPLNLAPGRPFSPALIEQDRNRILARYENAGYLNAQFQSTVTPDPANPHLADVTYSIDEGAQDVIGSVAIEGAHTTRQKYIQEITGSNVREGQPLGAGKLLSAESDLYNLGIFDWASVKPLAPPGQDEHQEEVLIKVHELPRNSIDVGLGFEVLPRSGNIPVGTIALPGIPPIGVGTKFTASQNSYWGPRGSFQFTRHNILGRAETASIGVVYSRLDQRANLTFTDPRLRGSSWSSLFSLSAERSTQNSIYTAASEQGSVQLEKAMGPRRSRTLTLRYTYQHTALSNLTVPGLVLPEDQHVRLSTLGAQYVRDTRDNPLDARRGIYQSASLDVSPKALGSSANFVRFFGQMSFYKPVAPWLTWANNFRLGIAQPFGGTSVPLSERFFSGGADSLRGFPVNGAGPQRPVTVCANPANPATCTVISVPVGGNMLAIFNSEARFPIPLKSGLGGVLFYDGGNVYSAINARQFANEFTHTVGFGIRYKTPVGPIRIDIGHRLTNVPGVNANQYFVTLGQAF